MSGLWLIAAALWQRPRTVKSDVRYSSTASCTVAKLEISHFQNVQLHVIKYDVSPARRHG